MKTIELCSLSTPCFIVSDEEFARCVNGFRDALVRKFQNPLIGYSVKTNSLPYLLKEAGRLGCMAEVVSHDEYTLARHCGFTPRQIIYNGPMKSFETFIEAVQEGAIVNLECKRELKWLHGLPNDGRIFNIGIRLNINISKVSPEDADGDDDNSRFGFSDESSEFIEALQKITEMPNVRLAGLHIHRTTHSRSPRFYERSIAYAASIIKKYDMKLDYLDVGGGYFGIFPNKPTFDDYAEAFRRPLAEAGLERLRIIVEPGNALTASCISFLSEVIDIKRVDDKTRFVTTDGSRNDVDPFFHKSDYLKEIFYITNPNDRETEPLQIVAGCTCLEYDRLFTLKDSVVLEPGDRILYKNVGAYTMTLSPLFIRLFPAVYAQKRNGEIELVRRAWTAHDYDIKS